MTSNDFLSGALEHSLETPTKLDFFVHALPVSLGRHVLLRAVEDATVDWSRLGAKRVKVATIEIGHQSEHFAARAKQAEEWKFSPWNALEAHRPLGSINRARRTAYPDGAAARSANAESLAGRQVSIPDGARRPDRNAAE